MTDLADLWPAPTSGPINATVNVPGSKSQNNRALPLAALAEEPTTITGSLISRDSDLMIGSLRALGTKIDIDGTTVKVIPAPLIGPAHIDCGLAGTVMRFLPPIAALATGEVVLDGDPAARARPMAPVLQALQDLNVEVTSPSGDKPVTHLPIKVHGTGSVEGGEVRVNASGSSQFISGLLLAAPRFRHGITVRHIGQTLPSVPHIAMTVDSLRARGVKVEMDEHYWSVAPGPILGGTVEIEPDLSNAAPFLAAALATGGRVRVPKWPSVTAQPGDLLQQILPQMGAQVSLDNGVLTVTGQDELIPLTINLSAGGELTPTLAALCTLAEGESRLTGIGHLRGHETDRLAALVTEIRKLGADAEEVSDGLIIRGGKARLVGAVMETYDDHRMATFASIIGLVVPGVQVRNIATTRKTIPDFPGMWAAMIKGD